MDGGRRTHRRAAVRPRSGNGSCGNGWNRIRVKRGGLLGPPWTHFFFGTRRPRSPWDERRSRKHLESAKADHLTGPGPAIRPGRRGGKWPQGAWPGAGGGAAARPRRRSRDSIFHLTWCMKHFHTRGGEMVYLAKRYRDQMLAVLNASICLLEGKLPTNPQNLWCGDPASRVG